VGSDSAQLEWNSRNELPTAVTDQVAATREGQLDACLQAQEVTVRVEQLGYAAITVQW
jgi:hypothetical protein